MNAAAAEQAPSTPATEIDEAGWEWAIVEVFGHRRHSGRIREVERFGAKFLRVDVPNEGDPDQHGWTTHFYAGGALFSLTPADQARCLHDNAPYAPPARLALAGPRADDQDEDLPY